MHRSLFLKNAFGAPRHRAAGARVRFPIAPKGRSMPRLASLLVSLLVLAAPAFAQDYPAKPIKLIVGFPPGGSNDIVARIVAPRLSEALGVPVVVENKPGANATIGTDLVAKSAPDGYTLLVASASPLVITPHTFAKIPYDTLKEFAGVSMIGVTPEAIAVNPKVPVSTLKELVELSRTRDVTLSSSGNGGMPHLAIELFKAASGGRIIHVPYKGAGPAVTDTLGGHVDGIVMDLPPIYAQIKEGKLKLLGITSDTRAAVLPDSPTTVEQGFPTFVAVNWVGLVAPAKTPRAVIDKLYAALVKIVADPQVRDQLAQNAVGPATMEPAAFQRFLASEFERWGKVARDSNAKAD
jgi:tripartite-type tricarboxylate transporter receptor subunit TctC